MELQEALRNLEELKKEKDVMVGENRCLTVLPATDQQLERDDLDLNDGGSEAEEEMAECTSADEGVPLIPISERPGKYVHAEDEVSANTLV